MKATSRVQGPDPALVAILCVQQLVPMGAIAAYASGVSPPRLVFVAVGAWLLATFAGLRSQKITRRVLAESVGDAVHGILSESAPRVRGRGHDEHLNAIWRAMDAREQLERDVSPSLWAGVLALPVALAVSAWLAGLFVAAVAVVAGALAVALRVPLGKRYNQRVEAMQIAYGKLARDLGHSLRALEDLQAHGLGPAFKRAVEEQASRLSSLEARAWAASRVATWAPLAAGGALFVLTLEAVGRFETLGLVELGALGALAPVVIGVTRNTVMRGRLHIEARTLRTLADHVDELPVPETPLAPPASLAPVVLESLTFSYGDGPPLFDDLGLRWSGTRPLAIVGANGSGKSTLLALLLRLIDPGSGAVKLGAEGSDIRSLDPSAFRARIGYVPQRPLLLEGMRVKDAMHLVAPDATDAMLLEALRTAKILPALASRTKDPLVLSCAELSVGELQRVAIARALARAATLLVFDEPEAALDPAGRLELRDLLESLAGEGKLVVIATQHEEVIPRNASRIALPLPRGARVTLE